MLLQLRSELRLCSGFRLRRSLSGLELSDHRRVGRGLLLEELAGVAGGLGLLGEPPVQVVVRRFVQLDQLPFGLKLLSRLLLELVALAGSESSVFCLFSFFADFDNVSVH